MGFDDLAIAAAETLAGSRSSRVRDIVGVRDTPEFRRVFQLPRRQWDPSAAEEAAELLTSVLRTPEGKQRLRPAQAIALAEIAECRGAFCPMRVGSGKTLVTLLAATVLRYLDPRSAQRPLLLIPAHLRTKTERDIRAARVHWQIPAYVRIESYQLLGRVQASTILATYRPDLIIADEAHKLKNPRAAVTKRLARYMKERPETAFLALSGTVSKRSIKDYKHLIQWALGSGAPIPLGWVDVEEWSEALDEKKINPEEARRQPGALTLLYDDVERELHKTEPLRAARRTFERRLNDTQGVISTLDDRVSCSLAVTASILAPEAALEPAFDTLRDRWELPDGQPMSDGFEKWRHARELAAGFWYHWDPMPPPEWLTARKEWCAFCRQILRTTRRQLDSEHQVALECSRDPEWYAQAVRAACGGDSGGAADPYFQWRAIRDTFKPRTVAVWLTEEILSKIANWMSDNPGGIFWTEHVEIGRKLQQLGFAYFGRKGLDATGRAIEDAPSDEAIVASIEANCEGRNLQARNTNLLLGGPTNALRWEQLLGRTHRDGQEADEVTAEVWLACREHAGGFEQARKDAVYQQDSLGAPQKLLYADVTAPAPTDSPLHSAAWRE